MTCVQCASPTCLGECESKIKAPAKINGIRITNHDGEFYIGVKQVGCSTYKQDSMRHTAADALARAGELLGVAPELQPVHGDLLPPVGSKVMIHLGRQDAWVEHTVTGYYAWGDHDGNDSLHRVFVRVVDADGYPNARLLKDVRPVSPPPGPSI